MSLIECINLHKLFVHGSATTVALQSVSLTINQGEFVAIMGPSGSGKSTLLHILSALDMPTSGTYFFNGTDVSTLRDVGLAKLRNEFFGFVFQSFNLLARADVLHNVMLPLAYSSIDESQWRGRALQLIESVGLSHRITHIPSELSGGEKQRVAIARALMCNPQVIFADEPTGNLDSGSGVQIMKLLDSLHKTQGRTVVVITHDMNIARFADRVITLQDGHVVSE